jgi:excinuclease ABC subunit A
VQVDQKPIGRTPRSNLATYTGLFDHVRKLFAGTPAARAGSATTPGASRSTWPRAAATCEGEGFVSVELLFMPSVYAPCPTCHGARYNAQTLEVTLRGKSIAEVLGMTVDEAHAFFEADAAVAAPAAVLRAIGLGYLRLGQPATELSGGEAQRIKLATELQRAQRGDTLYVLDEPTTGLHPADVDRLMVQLHELVDAGNTVVVVEHEMRWVARLRLGDRHGAGRRRRRRAHRGRSVSGNRGTSAGKSTGVRLIADSRVDSSKGSMRSVAVAKGLKG